MRRMDILCAASLALFYSGLAFAQSTLSQEQVALIQAGQGSPVEEAMYVQECAMDSVCRYSLVQSWSAQGGPNAMQYFSGSRDGSGSNPHLKGTDVGQMMAEIDSVNRCNLNTECRAMLVQTVATLRSLPMEVLREAYNKRGAGIAKSDSTAGAASTGRSSPPSVSMPSSGVGSTEYDMSYSPSRRAIVELEHGKGLVVNGRSIVDPAGPITRASDSNYRGIVTYATGLESNLLSINNLHIEDFLPREIATIRLMNWGTDARRAEITTTDGLRISGRNYWLVPGGIWVTSNEKETIGFLYSPERGIETVETPPSHYVISMIIGDVLGTNWMLVGMKRGALLGSRVEWFNIQTGETFAPLTILSPYEKGYGGAFQGETKLGKV